MFSICTADASLWGADILLIVTMLTRGLTLAIPNDEHVQFEGDFLKKPKNFTISHSPVQ